MATHPSKSKSPKKSGRAKVAEAVKVDGQWRVKCYKCKLLPEVYGNWTKAATAAWKHGKH
jgi:hypothetical protein